MQFLKGIVLIITQQVKSRDYIQGHKMKKKLNWGNDPSVPEPSGI